MLCGMLTHRAAANPPRLCVSYTFYMFYTANTTNS